MNEGINEGKPAFSRTLYWIPRGLAILVALFLALFALDVWGMEGTFWLKLGGFLIHLLPTFFILIALAIAWRWEAFGGLLFLALAVFFFLWFHQVLIAALPAVVGIFFLVARSLKMKANP
ncbi:MAG: hypothetical protein IH586_06875 [Anaerolineaceae bacterium]|nr:hypothetical protein [Anaerolineaceae bacterium]